ncbi:MAG: HlyD family efflux transporter periplasmic adaptor subunit [Candidatus Latescibacteria bacterium]|jgi:HlyD family secretion protein|nr:HlyD family efflux transporter periplasmic adaptor subunit [Candidatus Latescibacterota bacterium]
MMVSEQTPNQKEGKVVDLQSSSTGPKKVPSFLSGAANKPGAQQQPEPEKSGTGMDRQVKVNKWTLKRIASIAAVVLFVGAVVYMAIFGDHSAKLNVQIERITISEVIRGPFQEFIVQRGTVLPFQTHYIDALEGGQVEEIFLEEGTMVEKDTPILRLSNPRTEQTVMNQEATLFEQINIMENTRLNLESQANQNLQQLMRGELDLQQKERAYNRVKVLYEQGRDRGWISKDAFLTSQENYDHAKRLKEFLVQKVRQDSIIKIGRLTVLEKSAASLQFQLDNVRRPLENLTVRAPITGQLSQLNADIGATISPGIRIGQVDVLDKYKLTVPVDEFYIARIVIGLKGKTDFAGKTYELQIRRVFPEITEGQFDVDMTFLGDVPSDIRRGQTMQIKLELDAPSEALLLARGGFYQTTGGNWVFVVDESGTEATRRDVRIGRQSPDYFEVLEGLVPGERIVTSSYENYEEIDKLILKQ